MEKILLSSHQDADVTLSHVTPDRSRSGAPGSMLSERGLLGNIPLWGPGVKVISPSTFPAPSIILHLRLPQPRGPFSSLFAFDCPPAVSGLPVTDQSEVV